MWLVGLTGWWDLVAGSFGIWWLVWTGLCVIAGIVSLLRISGPCGVGII